MNEKSQIRIDYYLEKWIAVNDQVITYVSILVTSFDRE